MLRQIWIVLGAVMLLSIAPAWAIDSDGDGVEDALDNCPNVANPDQLDSDGEKIGDACDNCPGFGNVSQLDGDGDGAGNGCDNCHFDANPDQLDTDLDGMGDVCDDDADADSVLDDGDSSGIIGDHLCAHSETAGCDDNCRLEANPDQADADGDGVGDVCDNCPASSEDNNGRGDGCVGFYTWTVCASGCDFTTIHAAVDVALDGDIIELGEGTYYGAVQLGTAGQEFSVTIRGVGPERTRVDGMGSASVFNVLGGSVVLADMTITNAAAGIRLRCGASLVVDRCLIQDNGAGIEAIVATFPPFPSGGDCREGYSVTIEASTIANNLASGISLLGGVHRVSNSTISNNGADGIAGMGHQYCERCCGPTGEGCWDCCNYWSPELTVQDSTIAYNIGRGVVGYELGGMSMVASGIIAANNFGGDCIAGGRWEYSLFSDFGCGSSATNILMTDPLLLPLADNGGPTPTHALAPDSLALDAGGNDCLPTDQRGVARPHDGDGDGLAMCDIGAYEVDVLSVRIDIKPDGFPNSINPHSRGLIPVAVLGHDFFDVSDIDLTTLAFGPGHAAIAHLNGHVQDVNFDGIEDLVTHYRTRDTGITCGHGTATLTGVTLDGKPIEGSDAIQTVGCRETRRPAIWMKDQDRPDGPRRGGPFDIESR